MSGIYLGRLPEKFNFKSGMTLAELARSGPEADLLATEIIVELHKRVSDIMLQQGGNDILMAQSDPQPKKIWSFGDRLIPVDQILSEDGCPQKLREIFSFAADLHNEVKDTNEHVFGDGHPHHFKFRRNAASGEWTMDRFEPVFTPLLSQLATVAINPYWPLNHPVDAPLITVNQARYDRQVQKIAALTGRSGKDVNKAFLDSLLFNAAKRIAFGVPEGQTGADYFMEIAKFPARHLKDAPEFK